jgi:hypothetical protein
VREARKAVEAKESEKSDKEKDKDKAKDEKDKETGKGDDKDKDKAKDSPVPTSPSTPSIPVASAVPSHRKFALHRQIYDMRKNEIKRKEQGVKAREVGKGLPQVPRGGF